VEDELRRLIDDRNDAESDLESMYQELDALERADPENHEDSDEWNDLFHEVNEVVNHISYLSSCIDSIEIEDEDYE